MLELSMHILDIVENSVTAGATEVSISIMENQRRDILCIEIKDNGRGMDDAMLRKSMDPFVTTKKGKRVGLGLSMLSEASRNSGGEMEINSVPGEGTEIKATFGLTHLDRQPLGDMIETMIVLIIGHSEVEFIYHHEKDDKHFTWDTVRLHEHLGNIHRSSPEAIEFIRKDLRDFVNELKPNPINTN